MIKLRGGGGGAKAQNFASWSVDRMDILSSISYSNFRLTILPSRNFDFDYSHSQNLDYLTMEISRLQLVMVTK